MPVTRPPIRYQGGKFLLAPFIIDHFPPHERYTEVFGGGCSVLLRKPRGRLEVYNDLYDEVVRLFRVLRDPEKSKQLIHLLENTPFSRTEFEVSCQPARGMVEQARRIIVRSHQGFGSDSVFGRVTGWRDGAANLRHLPCREWSTFPETLHAVTQRLKGVVIENRPAVDVLRKYDHERTLHYVDPPYVHSTRSGGNPYDKKHLYAHELTDAEHEQLAEVLKALKGYVVLSGYPSALYDRLFSGWECVRKHLKDGNHPSVECLWLNPRATQALGRRGFDFEEVSA